MSDYAPTEQEIRETFLAKFDELSETRTEDRHPAPEFWAWISHEGYPIHGIDPVAFADEAFDLWERANATEANVLRWVSDAETRPTVVTDTVDRVVTQALDDLAYLIRRHVGQPAVPLAS
jgi:hypothetical protein